ncbi:MAG: right-handed parallel beta-helix repeat-containing protein [Planctomycetota bacterium]|nr:right-handed parallel beta-helix repeat-containing protein [Planctomycetota bacterium]
MKIQPLVALSSLALLVTALQARAAVRYVDGALATGAGTGASWADAYSGAASLQTALAAAVSGDEIWVKAGTYLPSTTGVRTASFTMKSGVAIYGGFNGTEATLSARNWKTNITILSGDLLGNDTASANYTENSYHVVLGTGAAVTAILDGFTVRAGYANGASASNQDKGGGILIVSSGAPTVRNCIFVSHRCTFGGGAGYIYAAQATFADCEFNDNNGASYGGAFDTNAVTSTFTRCIFRNNTAARAGAVETYGGGNTTYTNCLFAGNRSTGSGGGAAIWIGVSSSVVNARNCTFAGNVATTVAGGVNTTSAGTLNASNCVFWGNTGPGGATAANQINAGGGTNAVSWSIVQGGFTGTSNLSTDPMFVSAATGDYTLGTGSSGIDSGSNPLVPAGVTTDLLGALRFVDIPSVPDTGSGTAPIVDRGAYELASAVLPCIGDLTNNGVIDGGDLGVLLGGWGGSVTGDLDGNGVVNGADLGMLLGNWGPC